MHRQRFESQVHATRVVADWIAFHNQQRPRQALRKMTPYADYVVR
ncbi:integrase core domain-containing protein [Xanthomonas melonis]